MMLAGAILSLFEIVSMILLGARNVTAQPEIGSLPAALLPSFEGNETVLATVTGWLSLILIGRILMIIGLKNALANSGRTHPIMEFAVAMTIINVVLEVLTYALFATAAQLGARYPEGMVVMSWAAGALDRLFLGALGVSILCSAWAALRSELFPKFLPILGMVGGVPVALSAMFMAPSLTNIYEALLIGSPVAMIWVIWTGILVWRKAPKKITSAT